MTAAGSRLGSGTQGRKDSQDSHDSPRLLLLSIWSQVPSPHHRARPSPSPHVYCRACFGPPSTEVTIPHSTFLPSVLVPLTRQSWTCEEWPLTSHDVDRQPQVSTLRRCLPHLAAFTHKCTIPWHSRLSHVKPTHAVTTSRWIMHLSAWQSKCCD